MDKSSLVAILPEFNGNLVDGDMLDIYLNAVDVSLPNFKYKNETLAKAYWVAMEYFEAHKRAKELDGSSNIQSEKIEDITTVFKVKSNDTNPYSKLFYANIFKDEENPCDVVVGFMSCK